MLLWGYRACHCGVSGKLCFGKFRFELWAYFVLKSYLKGKMKFLNLFATMAVVTTADEIACGIQDGTYKLVDGFPPIGVSLELKSGAPHSLNLIWKSEYGQVDCDVALGPCMDRGSVMMEKVECHGPDEFAMRILKQMAFMQSPEDGLLILESGYGRLILTSK
eukprot:Gregarina_sp_Poly_1__5306@NODE_2805_length_1695_cov_84_436118_g1767_i0_p1_GENE_NODE_2805_length_1695_cov_84_436118_g1767_i0NODE_2805_length_1695_cov_84_436118_g1767_i0_p1_ORF_typecomplete_len163_score18_79_NODE_2805_length_1695_cov_84_436118_g1767_i07381226